MTAALTITRRGGTTRDVYDENDAAKVAEMAEKFAQVAGSGSLLYKTTDAGSETIRPDEFPRVGEAAEVTVSPQYSGG